ncbi:hypothetical protein [Brucella pseudogrignonensis]|uniref:hypothetical protein n=1 Tax=Brucella pseudogrignonensis TaxID=419475 RepID=UPI0038D0589C
MIRNLFIAGVISLFSSSVMAQEDEAEGMIVDLSESSPALHFPIGINGKSVQVVPAFEDYGYMLDDSCNAMELTFEDECKIFPMNADLGENAIATILEGNKVIDYDRQMSHDVGYDGAMAIIAHELGHHFCGHLGKTADPSRELEADRFAGAVMRKSKMSLDAAMAWATIMDERPSRSHPAKADRLKAIKAGWNAPESAKSCEKS